MHFNDSCMKWVVTSVNGSLSPRTKSSLCVNDDEKQEYIIRIALGFLTK